MKQDLKLVRETKIKIPEKSDNSNEIFAVCLETDDNKLLIPFKIYQIVPQGEYASVIDEKGDVAVYPSNFFLPLRLPSETINALSTAYSHIG